MVLTDLPYGNTSADWDVRVDEAALFKHIWRVDKGNAAMAQVAVNTCRAG